MNPLETAFIEDSFVSAVQDWLDTHTPEVPGISPWVEVPGTPQFQITTQGYIKALPNLAFSANGANLLQLSGVDFSKGFFVEFDFYFLGGGDTGSCSFYVQIKDIVAVVPSFIWNVGLNSNVGEFSLNAVAVGSVIGQTPVPVIYAGQAIRFKFQSTNYNTVQLFMNNNLMANLDFAYAVPDPSYTDWEISLNSTGNAEPDFSYEVRNFRAGKAEIPPIPPPPKVAAKVVNHTLFYKE